MVNTRLQTTKLQDQMQGGEGDMASPQRRSNRSRNIPRRFQQNDEGGEDERIGAQKEQITFSQKKSSLQPVKIRPTLRAMHLGKGTSGGTGDPGNSGSSSSSSSSKGRRSPRWGDESNSGENPKTQDGAPGDDDDPGDDDGDDSGDSESNPPPGPTRPPPGIERRITKLKEQVSKLETALEGIEQFCLSSENVLEQSLFEKVVDVENYITQRGLTLKETELNLLKEKYPEYNAAYREGCEDLCELLGAVTDMLYAFINREKSRVLFKGDVEEADKTSSRQAMALLNITRSAINQLLFLLPEIRTRDWKEWLSNMNQNIDRWGKETTPVQRVVTPEGGRDANGLPLITNQMHMGKVISEFTKTLKDTIISDVTSNPGPVSCAQFVIATEHVLRESTNRIERKVAQTDIGQTLIVIAKKALTTLDVQLDTDLQNAKSTLQGQSPESAQEHRSLSEWLKWLKETFSTRETLLAAILTSIKNEMNDVKGPSSTNQYGSFLHRGGKFGSNRFVSNRGRNSRSRDADANKPFQRR